MVNFKSCPKCNGDEIARSDGYGPYVTCVACGHVTYPLGDEADNPDGLLITALMREASHFHEWAQGPSRVAVQALAESA